MRKISRHKIVCATVLLSAVFFPLAAKDADKILKAGTSLTLDYDGSPAVILEAQCAPVTNRQTEGLGKSAWGFAWNDTEGTPYTLTLRWGNENFGTLTDRRYMQLAIARNDSILFTSEFSDGANLYKDPNTLKLTFDTDGTINWTVGGFALADAGSYNPGNATPNPSTFRLFTHGAALNVLKLNIRPNPLATVSPLTQFSSENSFPACTGMADSPEGVWMFLDRDTDPKWARPGGQYVLGIIRNENKNGVYSIIYLSGAVANGRRWKPGMLKGELTTTPFIRHYDLRWIDSTFDTIGKAEECWASMNDDGTILTFNFPLDRSVMRFYRKTREENAIEN